MVDFHTHILFDVDHGVKTKKTFSDLLKRYSKHGFDSVVLTPHLNHPNAGCKSKNIEKNFEEAKEIALQYGIKLYLGCELYFDCTRTDMEVLPINGEYLLVEFPVYSKPFRLEEKLKELQKRGFVIIVAHIERYRWIKPGSKIIQSLRDMGCLIQVNMKSVSRGKAKLYLKEHLVDIIASDNHGDLTSAAKLKRVLLRHPEVLEEMNSLLD